MKITKLILLFSVLAMFSSCGNDKNEATDTDTKTTVETQKEVTLDPNAKSIKLAESIIKWKGTKKIGDFHEGTIAIKSGNIITSPAGIVGGEFVIDMTTIADVDKDADLEGHLKSGDFFNVAKFPTSTFKISKVATLINNPKASHMVYGDITIRGITKAISFMAKMGKQGEGYRIIAPSFKIDRTDFDVKYNSSKFFDNLKDKLINDDIEISLFIIV